MGFRLSKPTEKVVLAFWVFAVSSCIHIGSNWLLSSQDIYIDGRVLMLTFLAGLLEVVIDGIGIFDFMPPLDRSMIGRLWTFLFFYCTVPPYHFPVYYSVATYKSSSKLSLSANKLS